MNIKISFYCVFCLQAKPESVNNLRKGIGSVSVYVQVIVYLSLYDLHKCINLSLAPDSIYYF